MSKSGVFAHFGSREELQISVVREYHATFEEEVFFPALREPRGLPRLRALFDHWMKRVSVEIDSGCIYISGAVEFDDRPGPVRDALVDDGAAPGRRRCERAIAPAIDEGHLRADTDADADAVRDPRPDPRAAPRRALPAHPRRARPRPRRLRAHRSRTTRAGRPRARAAGARKPRALTPFPTSTLQGALTMPSYTPPLRDMQFVLHEVLNVADELQGAAARTPRSTPTRSTRCSRKAASSPPR